MGLRSAPPLVKQAFGELRRSLGKPLSLHTISGGHYVYEYSSVSGAGGRRVVKTFYIGHITDDGKFIAKGQRELAKLEITDAAGQEAGEQYDEREAIALRNLSMNGRMSMAKLAKRVGMSVTGTRHFVKRLEEKYKIRYFAEVNTLKLGYLRYIALVKFEGKMPGVEEVRNAFEDDPHVALVAMTKGIYDMIVIFYLESSASIANFVYEWRKSKALPNYTAEWHISPLDMASGITMPLRKPVADLISITEPSNKLTKIEKVVLNELLLNGSQDFKSIDKNYSLGMGRSNYAFYNLKEKEVIDRITITIFPLYLKYNVIFITETNNYKKFTDNQDKRRLDLITENSIVNKYVFRGDIGAPDGIFQIRSIFNDSRFGLIKNEFDSINGTKTNSMIITEIVVGSLCYRNFDPTYTTVFDSLLKRGKVQEREKISY